MFVYVVFLFVNMLTVQRIQMNHSCLPVNSSRDLVGAQIFFTPILNTIFSVKGTVQFLFSILCFSLSGISYCHITEFFFDLAEV